MARRPYCDGEGVKKGPWTPEEDILLVSYIQAHGPGNWKAVPTNTGLQRCSKSCRLRWTNYLRPGIKRGNFTDKEENLIMHLQALLGNRWAVIASYLPDRTDNDIKNYWNGHLKKKAEKKQHLNSYVETGAVLSRGIWEKRIQNDPNTAKKALCDALSVDRQTTSSPSPSPSPTSSSSSSSYYGYASSTENISRLLLEWNRPRAPPARELGDEFGRGLSASKTETSETSSAAVEASCGSETEERTPLSMLEEWLLDESCYEGMTDVDLEQMEASGGPFWGY